MTSAKASGRAGKEQYCDRLSYVLQWLGCPVFREDGTVCPPKDAVWIVLSNALEGDMQPKYIYQVLLQDRWDVASNYRVFFTFDAQDSSSSSEATDSDIDSSHSKEEGKPVIRPRRQFKLIIPPSEWKELEPQPATYKRSDCASGKRNVLIPPKEKWTYVLRRLIFDQHELPCAFQFYQGRVTKEPTLAANYMTIKGTCTDPVCGSKIEGHILKKPLPNQSVTFLFEADDTRNDKLHTKKTRCGGIERTRVSGGIGESSAAFYRRQEASRLINRPGKKRPPMLYSNEVYRKIKQQVKEGALNRDKTATTMENLKLMKHDPKKHLGSIYDVCDDPVKVIYVTPGQILLNNSLKKQGYHQVQLDATGPYCRRISQVHGLSGQLLLYEFVVSTANGTAQLHQMVTEKQDAVTIGHWIELWMGQGALPPNEVITDDSAALLSAVTRKFGNCLSTKDYKQKCFEYLTGKTEKLPSCFVRLDHIHFIGKIAKSKIWKDTQNKVLKDHFLRFVGLLVLSETIEDFTTTLINILTLALSQTTGEGTPAEEARVSLIERVSGRLVPDISNDDGDYRETETDEDESNVDSILEFVQNCHNEAKKFSVNKGSMINPYFSEKTASLIIVESGSFPLWSAVMVKPFRSPFKVANTSAMEGDFSDLKGRVLKNEAKPMKLDIFVDKHLCSINGQNSIVSADYSSSSQKKIEEKITEENRMGKRKLTEEEEILDLEEESDDFEEDDENDDDDVQKDLRAKENWRGASKHRATSPVVTMKSSRTKRGQEEEFTSRKKVKTSAESSEETKNHPKHKNKRNPGYLEKNPNIDTTYVDKKGQLSQPKNLLLRNGNLTGYFNIQGLGMGLVKNTCSFDGVAQLLAVAYIDYPNLRIEVNNHSKDVPALKLVEMFATRGGCKEVYHKRAEVLIPFSILVTAKEVSSSARTKSRKSMSIVDYTLAKLGSEDIDDNRTPNGKIEPLLRLLFDQFPSVKTKFVCVNHHESIRSEVLINPQGEVLLESGISHLEESLQTTFSQEAMICQKCATDVIANGTPEGQGMLFINLSQFQYEKIMNVSLDDVPVSLNTGLKCYTLVGLVSLSGAHFVAYARRRPGYWEEFNDVKKKNKRSSSSKKITPHVLLYVLKP